MGIVVSIATALIVSFGCSKDMENPANLSTELHEMKQSSYNANESQERNPNNTDLPKQNTGSFCEASCIWGSCSVTCSGEGASCYCSWGFANCDCSAEAQDVRSYLLSSQEKASLLDFAEFCLNNLSPEPIGRSLHGDIQDFVSAISDQDQKAFSTSFSKLQATMATMSSTNQTLINSYLSTHGLPKIY